MTQNSQDELKRAYATLSSLRKNIGEMTTPYVPETYVHKFHKVLDRLAGIGIDVSEFRIPDSEIAPRITSFDTLTFPNKPKETHYSKEKYVDKSFILTQLDAILGYFEITMSEKPKRIGFNTSQE